MARVTRTSILTNRTRTLQLKRYEQDEFDRRIASVERGDILIEDAFPDLSKEAIRFIFDGTTNEEWESLEYGNEKGQFPVIYDRPKL